MVTGKRRHPIFAGPLFEPFLLTGGVRSGQVNLRTVDILNYLNFGRVWRMGVLILQKTVQWVDWDGKGLEHCVCQSDLDGIELEGVVVGTRHGHYGGSYLVVTDAAFATREVKVSYVGGAQMHVTSDGKGNWFDCIAKRELPSLAGCFDVDIGITPATNMLPIKRLKLAEGEAREISAAYVPLPSQIEGDFLPRSAPQRYTCLIPDRRYRYEGLFRNFSAELEIDDMGLVIDYPDTFRRV